MDNKKLGAEIRAARQGKGWSQERLAAEAGTSQSTIDRIETGNWKRMPSGLSKLIQALGVKPSGLDLGFLATASGALDKPSIALVGERNLPVYAAAEAGGGCVVVSTDPVDFVRRPAPLAEVKDGYGLIIILESMMPEFRPGDTALVHPYLPPLVGEACVFYADDGHGTVRATVKSFVRSTPTAWYVEQWNPPRTFTLVRKEWQKCHRIVGKYSRR